MPEQTPLLRTLQAQREAIAEASRQSPDPLAIHLGALDRQQNYPS